MWKVLTSGPTVPSIVGKGATPSPRGAWGTLVGANGFFFRPLPGPFAFFFDFGLGLGGVACTGARPIGAFGSGI